MKFRKIFLYLFIFVPIFLNANQVMNFDGDGDYISIEGDAPLFHAPISNHSISLWFKGANISENSGRQMLFEMGGRFNGMNIYLDNDQLYGGIWSTKWFLFFLPYRNFHWLSHAGISNNEWHHVVLIFNSGELELYLNGSRVGQFTFSDLSETGTPYGNPGIGGIEGRVDYHDDTGFFGTSTGPDLFDGAIDEVAVFNTALSESEVNSLYNQNATDDSQYIQNLSDLSPFAYYSMSNIYGVSVDNDADNLIDGQLITSGNDGSITTIYDGLLQGDTQNEDQSLPVELSSFSADYKDGIIFLKWETSSEIDNAGFNIYRGINNRRLFQKINDKLIPGAGNTTEKQSYIFKDNQVIEGYKYFYKIEDVSFSDKREFSQIISIIPNSENDNNKVSTFEITKCFPNPFNPRVNIIFKAPNQKNLEISIYDINGNLIKIFKNVRTNSGRGKISWNGLDNSNSPVSSGVYFCVIGRRNKQYDKRKITLIR